MRDEAGTTERALDLLFYAPVGLLLSAEELLPEIVAKGRQQVGVARTFGRFAVRQGQSEARRVVETARRHATATVEGALGVLGDLARGGPADVLRADGRGEGATASEPSPGALDDEALRRHDATPAMTVEPEPAPDVPAAPSLAIPDYESLAASQVVPRLAGLGAEELEAVRAYEAAHRGRKTVLNRISTLQPD